MGVSRFQRYSSHAKSRSHMNTNGRGLRNFKSFLSENDHPPSCLTLMRPQTILIKVNFEHLKLIISLRFFNGNFLCNLSVYSLMLRCKNILVFSRNSFFIWPQKNVNLHKFLSLKFAPTVNCFLSIQWQFIFDLKLFLHSLKSM